MALIFGFDIGTTSIGSAVIEYGPPHDVAKILHLGVRIFPEARDPDGTPLNQGRRQKRMARRQLRRRRVRRRALNESLAEAGLLPRFGTDDWRIVMTEEPTALRKKGLTEELTPYQVGRALYHLAQRRHFKGRDLDENDEADAPDEKEAKSNRDSTLQTLKANNWTLGELLAAKIPPPGQVPLGRHRLTHASRDVVTKEFNRLWDTQATYHPTLLGPEFRARVADGIFAQRPVFWRLNTLGKCRFLPGEPLCPKGAWLSQQRRMLEKLNNLALTGGNMRPLDDEERHAILEKLQTQASMTWPAVRNALKPLYKARGEAGREKAIRFNLEDGGDLKLLGNATEAKPADVFGAEWINHPHRQAIRDVVQTRIWEADYGKIGEQRVVIRTEAERTRLRDEAAQSFIADFAVTAKQAAALKDLNFPSGWEPYSAAALREFMPHLEAGTRFGALVNGPEFAEWRAAAFPHRDQPTGEILDRLPSPKQKEERERLGALRNPTVIRIQNELRKVVNNLISVYGKPDLIRVELAREVGKSKREREEMHAGQRKQERRRKDAADDLRTKGIEPSKNGREVEKWLLWKESSERCPYTGLQISFDALFRSGEFDREHIWPRSRTFDSNFGNLTLCRREVNLMKGNRTPYEFFEHRPDEWAGIANRLQGMAATKGGPGMSPGKVKRFLAQSIPEDFTSRQLNDTGFASRQAIGFLKRLWPDVGIEAPVNVQAVTGRVTAQLRRLWELNNILADDGEKTRADHRHHAIDALVVACAHPGLTQKLSAYWQQRDDVTAARPRLDPPWPNIRADAAREKDKIIVSHRVRKKVSGPLHAEMPLGYTGREITKNGTTFGIFVKRMPVEKLSLDTLQIGQVEDMSRQAKFVVRDPAVRDALRNHLEAVNKPHAKAYPPYPRTSPDGPEIRKVRVLAVQQKDLMVPVANGFAAPSNNHHIAIYRTPDGKVDFDVVTLFEASRRLAKHESIVRRKREDDEKLIMSLSPGDAVQFPGDKESETWIVCGAWANGQIVLEHANDAAHATTKRPNPAALVRAGARKVAIDPIGRPRGAGD
jgi:CRISPR-associated endonuclease Csn1